MLADGRATLVHGDPIVDTRDPVVLSSLSADPPPAPKDPAEGPAPIVVLRTRDDKKPKKAR